MNDKQIQTIEQVKRFLEGSEALEFRGLSAEDKYKGAETPVELQFLIAKEFSTLRSSIIKIVQIYRFFPLVDIATGKEKEGHLGL